MSNLCGQPLHLLAAYNIQIPKNVESLVVLGHTPSVLGRLCRACKKMLKTTCSFFLALFHVWRNYKTLPE